MNPILMKCEEQLSVDPMAMDAPPLPSRSPHEPLALAEKSNTSQNGEPSPRRSLPRRSPSPDVFQPGSLKAEEFYKSESNHPVPPVPPPRTNPTPSTKYILFQITLPVAFILPPLFVNKFSGSLSYTLERMISAHIRICFESLD